MSGTKKPQGGSQSSHTKPFQAQIYGETALKWQPPWKWSPEARERGSTSQQVRLHSLVTHFTRLPPYLSGVTITVSPFLTRCRVVSSCPSNHLHQQVTEVPLTANRASGPLDVHLAGKNVETQKRWPDHISQSQPSPTNRCLPPQTPF